jgi:tRNA modification GTPase
LSPDTIIALASGAGPAGVSVIRASGPAAKDLIIALSGQLPVPRIAALRELKDQNGDALDRALVLWFPGPASFTGEDVVEFHVHGGRAVVSDTIEACLKLRGVRYAQAGEFTRRAFDNGKMDLSAAEGLGDLIDAETGAQRRQALRQMDGALAHEVNAWRDDIIEALADAEGDIDFPDEDLPPGLSKRARDRIGALRDRLVQHIQDSRKAIRVREGFRVAILGAPNAGKSSLINSLSRRDAAIVSPRAGTTRDVVEVRLVLSGMVVWIADTAGLRETTDEIEQEGIRRALAFIENADLRLGILSQPNEKAAISSMMQEDDIWLLAKADLGHWQSHDLAGLPISSLTGAGIDQLEAIIAKKAKDDSKVSQSAPLTRLRHREAVQNTIAHLTRALEAQGSAVELVAEDLRLAARSLGHIIGRVDMEDVLDHLFSKFCIGK